MQSYRLCVILCKSKPTPVVLLACGSASTNSVLYSSTAKLAARLIAVVVLLSWGLTKNFNEHNASIVETKTCKEDSLKTIIESLKHELEAQDNGFDSKEKRYERRV